MAKPRVFLSSTYYDLKHVRERIERFLANFGMEPVLFESDNVTFEFNKPLDISCYNEVKTCHMMVLIVGGRYGSAATGEKVSQDRKDLYKQYVSITRKEHETATSVGVPAFVFIDKNVYAEYQTYKKNKKMFEDKIPFNFAHVDDINVFKFISILEPTTAIKTFDKVEEIENYLENQISGMLFLYLQQLQIQKQERKMLDSIAELNSISQRMNEMVSAIGKSILNDSGEYEKVIDNQDIMLITFFKDMFFDNVTFKSNSCTIEQCKAIIDSCFKIFFSDETINKLLEKETKESSFYSRVKDLEELFNAKLLLSDYGTIVENSNFYKIMRNYIMKIYPIIKKKPQLLKKMRELFIQDSQYQIPDLPF